MRRRFSCRYHMPVNPLNTKRLQLNLPIELYERVVRKAQAERRPVSQYIRNVLEDAVNK